MKDSMSCAIYIHNIYGLLFKIEFLKMDSSLIWLVFNSCLMSTSEPSFPLYKFTNHMFINVCDSIFIIHLEAVASTFLFWKRIVICFSSVVWHCFLFCLSLKIVEILSLPVLSQNKKWKARWITSKSKEHFI